MPSRSPIVITPLRRAASDRIGPDDPRYAELIRRGFNKRFEGRPDYIRLVSSTDDVVDAVQSAVRDGARLAVRSGGHCLENFVSDPAVRAIIDQKNSHRSKLRWRSARVCATADARRMRKAAPAVGWRGRRKGVAVDHLRGIAHTRPPLRGSAGDRDAM